MRINTTKSSRSWFVRLMLRAKDGPRTSGGLHHPPLLPKSTRVWRWPPWTKILYFLATLIAIYGTVLVFLHPSGVSLGYLAGLVGIFTVVAAGVQQIDRQLEERHAARLQAEQDSLRRFDQRFSAVTHDAASTNVDERAGAGAALMSFLREGNAAFYQQTYFYLLAHLKSTSLPTGSDQTFLRAFEGAAHLVLPGLAELDYASGSNHGEHWQTAKERRLAVDFSGATLSGADLTYLELSEADLSNAALDRAALSGSCLWRAYCPDANLSSATLRYANLEEAVLFRVIAPGADFSCANLVAARFAARRAARRHYFSDPTDMRGRAILRNAQFVRARLQGACMNGADLRDARFDGANLKGASFYGALLNTATRLTIVRTVSGSWEKAYWDPSVKRELKRLAETNQRSRVQISSHRKESHVPAMHYRSHPWPDHENPPRKIRQ